jgi:DNA-binding NtrC family response regulator
MKGTRILLAEDDAALACVIAEALNDIAVRTIVAQDGTSALTALRDDPAVRLLLTDVRMPNMNGYDLVKQALVEFPELKVVMMTGYSEENPPDDVLRAREFRFLRKPIGIDALQSLILEMLRRP